MEDLSQKSKTNERNPSINTSEARRNVLQPEMIAQFQSCLKNFSEQAQRQNSNENQLQRQPSSGAKPNSQTGSSQPQQFFDEEWCQVERILCTPTMQPLLRPGSFNELENTWQEGCMQILDVLVNLHFKKNCFGLKFTYYDSAFSKEQIEAKRDKIERVLGSEFVVEDLTQLQNLLFTKGLTSPYEFWTSLGKIFKAVIVLEPDEQSPIRQFNAIMRTLAVFMFKKWKQECNDHYQLFRSETISKYFDKNVGNSLSTPVAEQAYLTAKNLQEQAQQELQRQQEAKMINTSNLVRVDNSAMVQQQNDNANHSLVSHNPIDAQMDIYLTDLHLFQQILNQNQKILEIKMQLNLTDGLTPRVSVESMQNSINLFIQNQKLLQQLLNNFRRVHPMMQAFQNDIDNAYEKKIGQHDQALLELRDKLLNQNSHALEKMTNHKLKIDSNPSSESLKNNLVKGTNQVGSDSSSIEKGPMFIFDLPGNKLPHNVPTAEQQQPGQQRNMILPAAMTHNFGQQMNNQGIPLQQHFVQQTSPVPKIAVPQAMMGPESPAVQSKNPQQQAASQLSAKIQEFLAKAKNPLKIATQMPLHFKSMPVSPHSMNQSSSKSNFGGEKHYDRFLPSPQATVQQNGLHQTQQNDKSYNFALQQIWQQVFQQGNHDLSWVLLENETEKEILVSPFLYDEDVQQLLKNLFNNKKEQLSSQEFETNSSIQRFFLDRKKLHDTHSMMTQSDDQESFSGEPLFLVKWKGLSYKEISWEPLSALKGENYTKVQEFLSHKHQTSHNDRHFLTSLRPVQEKLLSIEAQNRLPMIQGNQDDAMVIDQIEKVNYKQIFALQKSVLDNFIADHLKKKRTQSSIDGVDQFYHKNYTKDEMISNSKVSQDQSLTKKKMIKATLKILQNKPDMNLSKLQLESIAILEQAFKSNRNIILADEQGLGKRVTLINFLKLLYYKYKLPGPFLIITREDKLTHWNRLFEKWSSFKTLVYADSQSYDGIENLRKWALYNLDLTVKGHMTQRNKIPAFQVLLTTPEHLNNQMDPLWSNTLFVQQIVDCAETLASRIKFTQLTCKRVIASSSNPMPCHYRDLDLLLNSIRPDLFDQPDKFGNKIPALPPQISSMNQLKQVSKTLSPLVTKQFATDHLKVFKHINHVTLNVKMTPAQQLVYSEVYLHHTNLLSKLGSLKELDARQAQQLTFIDDLLHKCCNSILLLDKKEKLFENYTSKMGKRELKSNIKQHLASGKMDMMQQVIDSIKTGSGKVIIATHQSDLILLLKKYFKEIHIACFVFHQPSTIDSINRFNFYNGQAVFLLEIGQKWEVDEFSFFDLDYIQNIMIFDQLGQPEKDLFDILSVATPFQTNVNVYRLVADNSYEQKLLQNHQLSYDLQALLFDEKFSQNYDDSLLQYMSLNHPISLTTSLENTRGLTNNNSPVTLLPPCHLDMIFKLSCQNIGIGRGLLENGKPGKKKGNQKQSQRHIKSDSSDSCSGLLGKVKVTCLQQLCQQLFRQQDEPQKFEVLKNKSKQRDKLRVNDRSIYLFQSLKKFYNTEDVNAPPYLSQNFYRSIFGNRFAQSADFSLEEGAFISEHSINVDSDKEQRCMHLECHSMFLESDESSSGPELRSSMDKLRSSLKQESTVFSLLRSQASYQKHLLKPKEQETVKKQLGLSKKYKQHYKQFASSHLITSTQNETNQQNSKNIKLIDTTDKHDQNENGGDDSHENMMQLINRIGGQASRQEIKMVARADGNGIKKQWMTKDNCYSEEANNDEIYTMNWDHMEKGQARFGKKTSEDNTLQKEPQMSAEAEKDFSPQHEAKETQRTIKNKLNEIQSDGELALFVNQTHTLLQTMSQPDKKLPNGAICHLCFNLVDSVAGQPQKQIVQCKGVCKKIYHADCARLKNIFTEEAVDQTNQPGANDSVVKIKGTKVSGPEELKMQEPPEEVKSRSDSSHGQGAATVTIQPKGSFVPDSFLCNPCKKNEASCFVCKEFGKIFTPDNANPAIVDNNGNTSHQESSQNKDETMVEKCIVGSCSKYYHTKCLKNNQNVCFYTNNKSETHFRCPLHYCSGCSISGNSVQILLCVACPTSYHLKCFRADRGAVKVTKKFILCGQHKDFVNLLIAKQQSTQQDSQKGQQKRSKGSSTKELVLGSRLLGQFTGQKLTHKKYMEDMAVQGELSVVQDADAKMIETGNSNNSGDDLATLQREVNEQQKSELHSDGDGASMRRRESKAKFKALQSMYRVLNKGHPDNERDML